jgi:hypothetical protein
MATGEREAHLGVTLVREIGHLNGQTARCARLA